MIIPAGYAQANFVYTGSALPQGAEWTMGFDVGGYGGDPAALADDLFNQYNTDNLESFHAANVALVRVDVKYGPNVTGPSGSHAGSIPGTAGGTADSPNTAMLIRKNTALGGRAGRGRFYLPGLPTAQVNEDGTLGAGFVASANTSFNAFWANCIVLGADPVVLHAAGSPIATPTPITSLTVDGRAATQRRRLRR